MISKPGRATHEVTNELAHVVESGNRFVSSVARVGKNEFESFFSIDGKHPYLYENPEIASHVSGTTFFDFSRQLMKAIGHLFYDVPLQARFALQKADIHFERFGRFNSNMLARVRVRRPIGSKPPFGVYRFSLNFFDGAVFIGRFKVSATAMPVEVEERLIARQFSQRESTQECKEPK